VRYKHTLCKLIILTYKWFILYPTGTISSVFSLVLGLHYFLSLTHLWILSLVHLWISYRVLCYTALVMFFSLFIAGIRVFRLVPFYLFTILWISTGLFFGHSWIVIHLNPQSIKHQEGSKRNWGTNLSMLKISRLRWIYAGLIYYNIPFKFYHYYGRHFFHFYRPQSIFCLAYYSYGCYNTPLIHIGLWMCLATLGAIILSCFKFPTPNY